MVRTSTMLVSLGFRRIFLVTFMYVVHSRIVRIYRVSLALDPGLKERGVCER